MNEKKEALRMEILKYIEKHSRVELGELAVLVGVEETDDLENGRDLRWICIRKCGMRYYVIWKRTVG